MKLVILLTSFFYTVSLWADCRVSTGTGTITIAESQSSTLFEKGKSLESQKTQDQDGLGTCYANTTSVVLKSILPNNPDISYAHAALVSSTDGWRASASWNDNASRTKFVDKTSSEEQDFTYGGYVCETVAALKKRGGACLQSKSLLEKKELMDPGVQERIFLGVGKYFDKVNDIKKDPAKFESFKKDLALVVETLQVENDKFIRQCEESKKTLPIDVALESIGMDAAVDLLDQKTACAQKKLDILKKAMTSDSVLTSDQIQVEYSKEVLARLQSRFSADEQLLKDINTFFKSTKDNKEFASALSKRVAGVVNQFLVEEFKSHDPNCILSEDGKSTLLSKDSDTGMNFLYSMKFDHNRNCSEEMKLLKGFQYDTLINTNQCSEAATVPLITNAIEPLLDIGHGLDKALELALSNPLSSHANQLTSILVPECSDKALLIPLDDVSCASFTTCDRTGQKDYDNSNYTGPKGSCHSIDTAKSMVRTKVVDAINENRAMGVSVCTSFLEDPNAKTDFCRKAGKGVEGHSMHSMTLSGYRCVEGKIEYEVLNSWGSSYCPVTEEGKTKNNAFDCVTDKYGNPTGRFWVKEDVLVDSTTDINAVLVKKK